MGYLSPAVPSHEKAIYRTSHSDSCSNRSLSRLLCRNFQDDGGRDVPFPDGRKNCKIPSADSNLSLKSSKILIKYYINQFPGEFSPEILLHTC